MPFQFQPYDNSDSTRTIASILGLQGQIQAQTAAQRANAIARNAEARSAATGRTGAAIAGAGQQFVGTLNDILQLKKEAPIRALQLQKMQQDVAARQAELVSEQEAPILQAKLADVVKSHRNADGTIDHKAVVSDLEADPSLSRLVPAYIDHAAKEKALFAQEPKKTREVVTVGPDGKKVTQIVEDTPGQSFAVPPPEPPKVTFGQPQIQIVGGKKALTRAGSDGQLYDTSLKPIPPDQVQPYERPRSTGGSSAEGSANGLTPDAVDYIATQYRILGPSGMPTRLDDTQKIPVLNAAAKQVKALGQTPAVAVQRQAAFKADSASLNKMSTMKSAAEAFENKANAQAGLVGELSAKVGRTQFPIVNDVLLTGKERIGGDENTHLFSNALLTFTTEYAKIMEGSTGSAAGSSEGARRDAARLISTALNNGTIQKTLAQMQWEMRQTIQGYDVTIQHITDRMGGTAPSTAPSGAAPQGETPEQRINRLLGQ